MMKSRKHNSKLYIVLCILFVLLLFILPIFIPWDPYRTNSEEIWSAPSVTHLLGTDSVGRDVLARLLLGGKISITIAACVELIAFPLGSVLGYIGGIIESRFWAVIDRFMDIIFSFPTIILALFLASVLGPGIKMVIIVITIVEIPVYYIYIKRLVRVLYSENYISELKILGIPKRVIFIYHVIPHLMPAMLPRIILNFATTILFESTLSILGIGVPSPMPSWGNMIRDGVTYMNTYPWLIISASMIFGAAAFLIFGLGDSVAEKTITKRSKN